MRVGHRTVRLTRPDKVLFPDDRIDKRQLAEYYGRIADVMLPHVQDRQGDPWKELARHAQSLPRRRTAA